MLNIIDKLRHSTKTMVAMKYSFYLKKQYINKDGKSPLYLNLYLHSQRKRLPVEIYLTTKEWSQKEQKVLKTCQHHIDYNLILKNIEAKINEIEIQFRLSGEILTVHKCAELILRPDLSIDFISFMEYEMNLKSMVENSLKNHRSVLKKLKEYRSTLLFADVTETFIMSYKRYMRTELNNQEVTIDSNIKVIKHYISIAKKRGYKINVDVDNIKIKQHRSNRTNLNLEEMKKLKDYYFSSFIKDSHKTTLGYFLINCMNGMRINDFLSLTREQMEANSFTFWNQKSKKTQTLFNNETTRKIINEDKSLFVNKITPKTINETIKEIAKFLGINKRITCHIARHSFATNYLRKGGKVEDLQILLGHSEIKTTMVYVHLVESEVIYSTRLLDD